MSIRGKLWLTILLSLFINMALLIGYYHWFVSDRIAGDYEALQTGLDARIAEIADEAARSEDPSAYLAGVSQQQNLQIRLEDLRGNRIFDSEPRQAASLHINSVKVVQRQDAAYLLKITEPVPINDVSNLPPARDLLNGEIVIIFVISIFV